MRIVGIRGGTGLPVETDGYSAADHLRAVLNCVSAIDVCVVNSSVIGTAVADRYVKSGSAVVSVSAKDEEEIRRNSVMPVAAPLARDCEMKARHDCGMLARLVVSLARDAAGAEQMICSQRNGR